MTHRQPDLPEESQRGPRSPKCVQPLDPGAPSLEGAALGHPLGTGAWEDGVCDPPPHALWPIIPLSRDKEIQMKSRKEERIGK